MATTRICAAVVALAAITAPAAAQSLAGKTVNLVIGFGPGGIVYVTMRDAGATRIEKRLFK